MGMSMGGMQTWMWGERHPDMMDALMPVASLPERVTGRNLLWRRLLLRIVQVDEPAQTIRGGRGGTGRFSSFPRIIPRPQRRLLKKPE
jgi:homoserine acetyltransferase